MPNTRTVNGKALSSDITLTASDVGAVAKGFRLEFRYICGNSFGLSATNTSDMLELDINKDLFCETLFFIMTFSTDMIAAGHCVDVLFITTNDSGSQRSINIGKYHNTSGSVNFSKNRSSVLIGPFGNVIKPINDAAYPVKACYKEDASSNTATGLKYPPKVKVELSGYSGTTGNTYFNVGVYAGILRTDS